MLTECYVLFLVIIVVVFRMNVNFQDVNNDVSKDPSISFHCRYLYMILSRKEINT